MRNLTQKPFKTYAFSVSALLTTVGANTAFAQTANDLEGAVTQGSQFEDAQLYLDKNRQQIETASTLKGEPGVFILRKVDIFSAGAAIGSGFSDNPGRTFDTNAEDSFYGSIALSAGVNTRIAGQYDAGINIVASGTEYDRGDAPSNRNLLTNAYVGRPILNGNLYISANASVGVNTDRKFNNGTMFYNTGLSGSTVRKLSDRIIVRPSVSVSRQWSGQSEQNNYAVTAATDVIWKPAQKWLVRGQVSYTHRIYDNFFEDVTFVERKDNLIRAGLSVSRQITDFADVSVSIDYTDQNSDFFLSAYNAFDVGASAKVTHRF